ncbi:MAG: PIN domain nuclease [Acidobacteriota bacterium]|nr:PIN domain nuclease [Acidobacteriota bacterium]MDE3044055.1 PIN domain nuclease [Acidobacteriota bacterium]MDE3107692.1 PIN domain nuclease [Acidobacteriota bacterium]MDE3222846.1 PIN domain nuclease [Acidobacteriota bacterium]
MIFVDSSAWIEFLRDTGSTTCRRVDQLLGSDLATCEPVSMEVLSGARDEAHLRDLRRLLGSTTLILTLSRDYEDASTIYRACRRGGDTPRTLMDCLIAAITIRHNATLLHADADFDAIARHTRLKTDR